MKKGYIKQIIAFIVLTGTLASCQYIVKENDGIKNINIFANTNAWELAKAVKSQNTGRIKKIAKENPELLNYQDPIYGTTLLIWAVGMEKYGSVEALLEGGANPDIISVYYGYNTLYLAAGYSWIDRQAKKDPKYVKLLLEYGADPNIVTVVAEKSKKNVSADGTVTYVDIGSSPLMQSIGCGIEKTRALVEAGADINQKNEDGMTPTIQALWLPGNEYEYAFYLIAEKKANVTEPWIRKPLHAPPEEVALVSFLRDWLPELDSENRKKKLEIIAEFARQGVDY